MPSDNNDRQVGRHRRESSAAPVEHDDVRLELHGDANTFGDVGGRDRAGETASATPAPDRCHADERSWWPWACVAGMTLGAVGYLYVRRGRGNAAGVE